MAGFTVDNHVVTLTEGDDVYIDNQQPGVDAGVIYGLGGADTIAGGAYTGDIYGGDGNDVLIGGNEYRTTLYGGAGSNSYSNGTVVLAENPDDYLYVGIGRESAALVAIDGSGTQTLAGGVPALQFANGRTIAFADLPNYISAGAAPGGTPEIPPVQPDGAIRTLTTTAYGQAVMTPDSQSVLFAAGDGTVTRVDLATGATTGHWQVGAQLGGMDVTADGHYLVATELVAGPNSSTNGDYHTAIYVHRLDLTSGEVKTFEADVPVSASVFFDVATTSDGKAILSENGGAATPLFTMDIASGSFTTSAQTYPSGAVLTAATDHSHVLISPTGSAAPLYLYTAAGAGVTATHAAGADGVTGSATSLVATSAGGKYSLELTGTHLYLYDSQLKLAADLTALHPELTGASIGGTIGAAFSPDATSLYLLDASSDQVLKLDTASGALQASLPIGFDSTAYGPSAITTYGGSLQISADGHYLGILADGPYPYNAQYQLIDLTKAVAQTDLDNDNVIAASGSGETYYGFGGNDVFEAANGASAAGGSGNDSYVYVYGGGTITEGANGGYDTVYAPIFSLPANVERLIGLSSSSDSLIGNDDANTIVGNTGDDYLRPGLGADLLTGGRGSDVFTGSMAELSGDTITDLANGERIDLSDANPTTFTFSRNGDQITYGAGYSITLTTPPTGRIIALDVIGNYKPRYDYVSLHVLNHDGGISDFNGDGHSDILWRNTNGQVSEWRFSSAIGSSQAIPDTFDSYADPSWKITDTFDWNGDGRSDILWRNASGAFSVWSQAGNGFTANSYTDYSVGTEWRIAGTGDFNGDGKDDIYWQRSDGAISVWQSTGTGFTPTVYYHESAGPGWSLAGVADLNGDGLADMVWRNQSGAVGTWINAGGYYQTAYSANVDPSWHIAGLADFNGDGKADILWRNDDGEVSIWRANGNGFDQNFAHDYADPSWHIVQAGDFNGDGVGDILWRNDNGALATWTATLYDGGNTVYFGHGAADYGAPTSWSVAGHDFSFG